MTLRRAEIEEEDRYLLRQQQDFRRAALRLSAVAAMAR